MAWLKVDQTLRDHHKVCDSAAALDVPPAHMTGMMVLLWLWALDNAPDGDLTRISPGTIARAAQWPGAPERFIEVLKSQHLVDDGPDGIYIHDWDERGGKLLDSRLADAERKRKEREMKRQKAQKRPLDVQRTSNGHPADVRRTSDSRLRVDIDNNITPPIAPQGDVDDVVDDHVDDAVDAEKKISRYEQRFTEFWQAYPKKVGKAAALKSWMKLKPSAELHKRIMKAVEAQKPSDQWTTEDGRFIPNPTTWLNQGRWEDELPPPSKGKGIMSAANYVDPTGPTKKEDVDRMKRMLARMESSDDGNGKNGG